MTPNSTFRHTWLANCCIFTNILKILQYNKFCIRICSFSVFIYLRGNPFWDRVDRPYAYAPASRSSRFLPFCFLPSLFLFSPPFCPFLLYQWGCPLAWSVLNNAGTVACVIVECADALRLSNGKSFRFIKMVRRNVQKGHLQVLPERGPGKSRVYVLSYTNYGSSQSGMLAIIDSRTYGWQRATLILLLSILLSWKLLSTLWLIHTKKIVLLIKLALDITRNDFCL